MPKKRKAVYDYDDRNFDSNHYKRFISWFFEERVRENTRINMKLDNINSTTQDIKSELSSVRTDIQKHNDKIIILEQSCKQAHKRIDELNIRLNMNEDDEVKAYEKLEKLGKGRND